MNIQKIIALVALAIAVVAAFISIPYVAAILVVLGVPIGLWAAGDAHVAMVRTGLRGKSHSLRVARLAIERHRRARTA